MGTLLIARLTFREAVRRKALYGAIALTIAFLIFYGWGMGVAVSELNHRVASDSAEIGRLARQSGVDVRELAIGELFLAGLYTVANIASLLAIFMAAGTISQEVEQGTLHSIVSKPLARWEVILGKWLGGGAMLAVYVALTASATAAIVYWRGGYFSSRLPLAIVLIALEATLLYSLTMVASALLPAITTGIILLIIYVVSNVTGMVEQLGVAVGIETMVKVGVISSLIVPSDALWKMATAAVQPPNPLAALGLNFSIGPFGVLHPPSAWMGLYGLLYTLAALALATWLFSRRDL